MQCAKGHDAVNMILVAQGDWDAEEQLRYYKIYQCPTCGRRMIGHKPAWAENWLLEDYYGSLPDREVHWLQRPVSGLGFILIFGALLAVLALGNALGVWAAVLGSAGLVALLIFLGRRGF